MSWASASVRLACVSSSIKRRRSDGDGEWLQTRSGTTKTTMGGSCVLAISCIWRTASAARTADRIRRTSSWPDDGDDDSVPEPPLRPEGLREEDEGGEGGMEGDGVGETEVKEAPRPSEGEPAFSYLSCMAMGA